MWSVALGFRLTEMKSPSRKIFRNFHFPNRHPPEAMRISPKIWAASALAAAGILALCWKIDPSGNPRSARPAGVPPVQVHGTGTSPVNPVSETFGRLRVGSDSRATLETLGQLQEKLRSMPPDQAVACIQGFLKNGTDKDTGLTFRISNDHTLSEWPTFRTFLLDALFTIDPKAAVAISREILTTSTTADEWALALRNVGLADTTSETSAYLIERTEALIANPALQANPSVGYLNAFDVLVHTNATSSTPLLSSLIQRKDRNDLAHAAFLTLDRLVQRNPADELSRLASDIPLQQSRPEMTAQQFARADLRDPVQRDIVKTWLLDPTRTATELRSFAGVYPNNNRFISSNLLTTETQQSGADLAAHDREALEIIGTWEKDPALAPLKPCLTTMRQRLATFVREGQANN
jgi:hypothetical protein